MAVVKRVAQVMPVGISQVAVVVTLASVERNLSRDSERMASIAENVLPVREPLLLLL